MVDWTKGRGEAQAIAEPWTRQGGPGGTIVLFDRDGVRESASGGFAVIEHRLPFTPDTQNRLASISKHICAALLLRGTEWRDVLRGPHVEQARLVLQHLIDLPIRITNQAAPDYIGKWAANTRPGGLLVGLVQKVASPTGFEPVFWP